MKTFGYCLLAITFALPINAAAQATASSKQCTCVQGINRKVVEDSCSHKAECSATEQCIVQQMDPQGKAPPLEEGETLKQAIDSLKMWLKAEDDARQGFFAATSEEEKADALSKMEAASEAASKIKNRLKLYVKFCEVVTFSVPQKSQSSGGIKSGATFENYLTDSLLAAEQEGMFEPEYSVGYEDR